LSFDSELRHDDIATLKTRHEVGVTWMFIKNLDRDSEEVRNENAELPKALALWRSGALDNSNDRLSPRTHQ